MFTPAVSSHVRAPSALATTTTSTPLPMPPAEKEVELLTPLSEITHIVLTQLDPKNIPSLEALLKARLASKPSNKLEVVLSNPAARLLQSAMGKLSLMLIHSVPAACIVCRLPKAPLGLPNPRTCMPTLHACTHPRRRQGGQGCHPQQRQHLCGPLGHECASGHRRGGAEPHGAPHTPMARHAHGLRRPEVSHEGFLGGG